MIHFLAAYPDTIKHFIDAWAPELGERIRPVAYRKAWFHRFRLPGACIFSDVELLSAGQLFFARKFSRRLQGVHEILNDPDRCLNRFALLKALHGRGLNHFRAHRPDQLPDDLKFPVFLRRETDHRGSRSGLLHSQSELERAIAKLSFRGRWFLWRRLMVVEYVECAAADGLFRKYSAMNVGGTLIPRHILFSRNWVTKKADFVSATTVEEEIAFLEKFPHREQVTEIFRLAGVDYGRVDYGLKNGRVQVWEINTNPTVVPRREKIDKRRLPAQSQSAALIAQALASLAQR